MKKKRLELDLSRVLFLQAIGQQGGYLSGTPVTKRLKRHTFIGAGKKSTVAPRPCTQPGFTWPAPLDAAGALLPHPCTLTRKSQKCKVRSMNLKLGFHSSFIVPTSAFPLAVCFCGTLLTVARTGRYPASVTFREPGLSSGGKAPVPKHGFLRPATTEPTLEVQCIASRCSLIRGVIDNLQASAAEAHGGFAIGFLLAL